MLRVTVDVIAVPDAPLDARRFVVDAPEDITFADLRDICATRARVDASTVRVHVKGKACRDDDSPRKHATRDGRLRVSVMPDPAARRRAMDAELRRLRDEQRRKFAEARSDENSSDDAAAKRRATTAIDDKTRECERLSAEVDALERFGSDGARTRERLHFLSDAFERALVHLDGIDSLGDDDVRAARKRAVRFVDALAERVIDMKSRLAEGGEAGA